MVGPTSRCAKQDDCGWCEEKKKMQTSARKRSDISGYARNVQCQHLFWQLGWNETADVMGTDKSMTEFKCVFDLPHVQTG